MKPIKMIVQHNVNNFVLSVSLSWQLYREGSLSKFRLMIHLLKSFTERLKPFHWSLSSF